MSLSWRKSLFEVHLATALFGLAGLFGKWISLSPFLIVLGRVLFASLALGIFLLARGQRLKKILQENALLLPLLGFILAVHWTAFFKSIQVSTVAIGLLSYSCFPVFTVFLEPLVQRQRLDKLNLLLAGWCLCGVSLVIPRFRLDDLNYQGMLWGLFSGFTFAILTLLNRRLSQRHSSLAIAFFEDLWAALFLLPFFFFYPGKMTPKNIFLVLILGVICTAGSHTLFIKGLRQIRAQTASIISSLEPVYGITLAFFLLGEVPSWRTMAGGFLILCAVLAVSLRERARSQRP